MARSTCLPLNDTTGLRLVLFICGNLPSRGCICQACQLLFEQPQRHSATNTEHTRLPCCCTTSQAGSTLASYSQIRVWSSADAETVQALKRHMKRAGSLGHAWRPCCAHSWLHLLLWRW